MCVYGGGVGLCERWCCLPLSSSQLSVSHGGLGSGVAIGGGWGLGLHTVRGLPVDARLLLGLGGVEGGHRHQRVALVLLIHWVRVLSLEINESVMLASI